ncbi:hypothetical protein LIN78_14060 [Leeia sp. TBRC 13508]|uniref:Uncharacterized protein n=1 Tax=Leeia speluncae TaxID=2884804 RepID=A0ABS8DAN2_9NEIS|nr:hypothetical protein [Leeia speluncae]MCB6184668.1 hypothetical protein [Leeia speluncae]
MKNKFKIIITVIFGFIFAIWLLALGSIEYNKTGRCYKDNRVLGPNELRSRWIKTYYKDSIDGFRDDFPDFNRLEFYLVGEYIDFDKKIDLVKKGNVFKFNGLRKIRIKSSGDIDEIKNDAFFEKSTLIIVDPLNFFSFISLGDDEILDVNSNVELKKRYDKLNFIGDFYEGLYKSKSRYVVRSPYSDSYDFNGFRDDHGVITNFHKERVRHLDFERWVNIKVSQINERRISKNEITKFGGVYYVLSTCGDFYSGFVINK